MELVGLFIVLLLQSFQLSRVLLLGGLDLKFHRTSHLKNEIYER